MTIKKLQFEAPSEATKQMWEQLWRERQEQLRERLIYLCTSLAPSRGRYEYLETRTSISASKWKNVFLKRQMPTLEMLLAMCQYHAHSAGWLMNGTAISPQSAPSDDSWASFVEQRQWSEKKRTAVEKNGPASPLSPDMLQEIAKRRTDGVWPFGAPKDDQEN